MNTYVPLGPPGSGSIRRELEIQLAAEAERLRLGLPDDPDEQARLEQLLSLWRDGYRGIAPPRLRPEVLLQVPAQEPVRQEVLR